MPAKCLTALLFAVATAVAPTTFAQAWPTQPIKVIVGFPPGGVADAIPRYLQEKLKDSLGQPIVVENKPGARDAFRDAFDSQGPLVAVCVVNLHGERTLVARCSPAQAELRATALRAAGHRVEGKRPVSTVLN